MRRSARSIVLVVVIAAAAGGGIVGATSASSAKLSVRAAVLTKTTGNTWKGQAASKQLGTGQLTLTGSVTFPPNATPSKSTLRFRVTFKGGFLSGCLHNTILRRPGNRYVWDGPGQVTRTSARLRRYRGLKVRDGGETKTGDLTHSRPFEFSTGAPGSKCS